MRAFSINLNGAQYHGVLAQDVSCRGKSPRTGEVAAATPWRPAVDLAVSRHGEYIPTGREREKVPAETQIPNVSGLRQPAVFYVSVSFLTHRLRAGGL